MSSFDCNKDFSFLGESESIRPNIPLDLLNSLKSPSDLRSMSLKELQRLALEIRTVLCNLSEKRGVHFASNLGVVELTIALHTVFDFSQDRLVWDVGHQCYPHKILTGRFNKIDSIRTRGGLAGYPNPAESDYDLFMTGHAGCSVGTALGLACGDDIVSSIVGEKVICDEKVKLGGANFSVAVVGDGAFSSGPIFEALNHAGGLQQKMLVILNDNKMSICKRVGGLGIYLDHIRVAPSYLGIKNLVRRIVEHIPSAYSFLSKFKHFLKGTLVKGVFFEDFGFQYMGPIDGHDLTTLRKYLEASKKSSKPVLLHVLTEKGRGFLPAEEDPSKFHSTSPSKILDLERRNFTKEVTNITSERKSNRRLSSVLGVSRTDNDGELLDERLESRLNINRGSLNCQTHSFTHCAQAAIYKALKNDPRVCVIVAAMTQGNNLEKARADFPERFFDVGICEAHAVNFAAGLAKSGLRPIVVIYSGFLQRAYDHLFQEAALQDLPIVFALDRAGLVGPDGATHHGVFDLSYLRPFPNFSVVAPGDGVDMEEAFNFALKYSHPIAIRYPKTESSSIVRDVAPYREGKSEILRKGRDGALIVCGGGLLNTAYDFAERVASDPAPFGRLLELSVINARFIKPLDTDIVLQPLREGKPVVTLEESMLSGGFGSAVLEAANDEGLDIRPLVRMGVPDRFVEHGSREEELKDVGLDVEGIVGAFKKASERLLQARKSSIIDY